MAKLENILTWSTSRDHLFRSCKRAYYYNYYGSWYGWDKSSPKRTQQIYRLKNIKSLALWAGSIVHDTIEESLNHYAQNAKKITQGEIQSRARVKLRRGWVEAVEKTWIRTPKKTNLFELYYGNQTTLPKEQTDEIKEKIYSALTAFAQSAILKEILAIPYCDWRTVDTLSYFMLSGLKIWAAIDFAYSDGNGLLHIVDWKTGKENKEELTRQLSCYTLFAMEKWKLSSIDRIRTCGVYLNENARVANYSISNENLAETKERILNSTIEMRALLDDVDKNLASEKNFAKTDSTFKCEYCNFKELCL